MAYSSREELLALPGQISLSSLFADKWFFVVVVVFSILLFY